MLWRGGDVVIDACTVERRTSMRYALLLLALLVVMIPGRSAADGGSSQQEQQPPLPLDDNRTPDSRSDAASFASQLNQNWKETTVPDEDASITASSAERAMKDVLTGDDDRFAAMAQQQQQEFCRGMYMTMFMDGFRWTLLLSKPSPQCLSYFVQSWRLENASKFKGAMLFTFLLAILLEGLSSARGVLVRSSALPIFSNHRRRQSLLLTLIYALQALLGYILMLITMSFSMELFLSVIVGLMVGNLLFIRYNEVPNAHRQRSQRDVTRNSTTASGEAGAETSPLLTGAGTDNANLRRRS